MNNKRLRIRRAWLAMLFVAGLGLQSFGPSDQVAAAACVAPATDYGTVSNLSVNITTAGTYRIWTRMAAANSSNNTYLLEVDNNTCFTVGGSTVPTYVSGATTHFASGISNWINQTSSGSAVSMSLGVGTHTFELIGNAAGVVVDRLIVTSSTTCVPSGTGDNCAETTPPVISSIASSNVTHNRATVTWSTNEAADTQVQYGPTTSYGSTTTLNTSLITSHSVNITSLNAGTTYHYRVVSNDQAGNQTISVDNTFTTSATPAYIPSDINQNGAVDLPDLGVLIQYWGQSNPANPRADINGNGVVDLPDLGSLIQFWGQ